MRILNSCINEFSVCFSDFTFSAVNPFLSAFIFNAGFLAFSFNLSGYGFVLLCKNLIRHCSFRFALLFLGSVYKRVFVSDWILRKY